MKKGIFKGSLMHKTNKMIKEIEFVHSSTFSPSVLSLSLALPLSLFLSHFILHAMQNPCICEALRCLL